MSHNNHTKFSLGRASSTIFKKTFAGIRAHKIASGVIIITLIVGGYGMYSGAKSDNATPQYLVTRARIGNITQTVSGSGQVSAANQIDVQSQVSGTVTSIVVKVGERVEAGQLIATIDNRNALSSLESARLSLAQLLESAKPGDITNAINSVNKSYSDASNSLRSAFSDLQTIMAGINSMLYEQNGFLTSAKESFLSEAAQKYRTIAGQNFDARKIEYQNLLITYADLNKKSSTSTIESVTYTTSKVLGDIGGVLKDLQNAVNYVISHDPNYQPSLATSANNNVSTWIGMINSNISSVTGAYNTIKSNENTYNNLVTGADELDIQASRLSVAQAQRTYDNYFIRAPFAGVIGRIPVSLYSQAGSATVIATVVGERKMANISLDEVDAAKVAVGQPATITFDAINNFKATGSVYEVDLVGTVSGGVVSYNVKIGIDTSDPRIRPGMSMNVTIVTNEKSGVLIVPSASIKTQADGSSYVQILDINLASTTNKNRIGGFATSTRSFASTTRSFASTTRNFTGTNFGGTNTNITVGSSVAPKNLTVVTGLSDDTNIEIVSGLSGREVVVIRAVTTKNSSTTAAPNILSSIGARSGIGSNATRIPSR